MYIPLYFESIFLFPSRRTVGNVRSSPECATALLLVDKRGRRSEPEQDRGRDGKGRRVESDDELFFHLSTFDISPGEK